MKVHIRKLTSWADVLDSACSTAGKLCRGVEPSHDWKMKALMSRHSIIQALHFSITLIDIPYWVSVHLVRHSVGITHFVRSQRTDRTGVDRDSLPQNAPVIHRMDLNAQSILAISRKRLCEKASPETRQAWGAVKTAMIPVCPELAAFMQPECWWCGDRCPEMFPCGRCKIKQMPDFAEVLT